MSRVYRSRKASFTMKDIGDIDYKNVEALKKVITETGKIIPSRISGIRVLHQRRLTQAVKWARYLGLLPYCDRHQ
ncbi:MAG: 30S ribosomal protein S18 [Gammaproteobacteria bacterium]|nr:30S ribosomal protein S18 [Gammaproteobacteria bacterium]MCP4474327.1 30S ribosomal protein S18 [Gammaproteobacteria bacterium]